MRAFRFCAAVAVLVAVVFLLVWFTRPVDGASLGDRERSAIGDRVKGKLSDRQGRFKKLRERLRERRHGKSGGGSVEPPAGASNVEEQTKEPAVKRAPKVPV